MNEDLAGKAVKDGSGARMLAHPYEVWKYMLKLNEAHLQCGA